MDGYASSSRANRPPELNFVYSCKQTSLYTKISPSKKRPSLLQEERCWNCSSVTSTSRGLLPSYGPTTPLASIESMSRAARV